LVLLGKQNIEVTMPKTLMDISCNFPNSTVYRIKHLEVQLNKAVLMHLVDTGFSQLYQTSW